MHACISHHPCGHVVRQEHHALTQTCHHFRPEVCPDCRRAHYSGRPVFGETPAPAVARAYTDEGGGWWALGADGEYHPSEEPWWAGFEMAKRGTS